MLQAAGETQADRHHRAVREAARWYTQRLSGATHAPDVVLLTLDADAQARARAEGLQAPALAEFADRYVKDQAVLDLIAWCAGA